MRALLFMLILVVLLSLILAMPYEDRNEQKTANNGILRHLLHLFGNSMMYICPFLGQANLSQGLIQYSIQSQNDYSQQMAIHEIVNYHNQLYSKF